MRVVLSSSKCLPCLYRSFSSSTRRCIITDIAQLPDRIIPSFRKSNGSDLLELRWPLPPRNVLLSKKDRSPPATEALLEFAQHITSEYPDISLIAEPNITKLLNEQLPNTLCAPTHHASEPGSDLFHELPHVHAKTDLVATFGGDGTILRACSLFSTPSTAPPILSFAMGTLGFLGEWKFKDHKHAFHELYVSGSSHKVASSRPVNSRAGSDYANNGKLVDQHRTHSTQTAKVLFRRRLRVALSGPNGTSSSWSHGKEHHAMNEVLLYRGANPHLIHILIHVNGRFLTEAVADGMLVSTPTGSTAYSLSSGGSIIHPTVPALLLTPICPRSLSFRPLVLPASSEITLTLSEKNRSKEAEFSIDGLRRPEGVGIGYQIKVTGKQQVREQTCAARGEEEDDHAAADICGVPFVMRGDVEGGGDDGWVGGLTNLLKFNYPFAAEED